MAQIRLRSLNSRGVNRKPLQVIFTSSQTYTIPTGYKSMDIFLVGAGGDGGLGKLKGIGQTWSYSAGGGGGGGYTKTNNLVNITNKSLSIEVGSNGGNTKITMSDTAYQANGGSAGKCSKDVNTQGTTGGAGGSGGGGGQRAYTNNYNYNYGVGDGGSDGTDGGYAQGRTGVERMYGGSGQGTTTREFGLTNGTLYSGGGGGGGAYSQLKGSTIRCSGAGQAGDGGGGGVVGGVVGGKLKPNGDANTGGGGCGGGYAHDTTTNLESKVTGGNGGSGIAIIRLYKNSSRPTVVWDTSNTINK